MRAREMAGRWGVLPLGASQLAGGDRINLQDSVVQPFPQGPRLGQMLRGPRRFPSSADAWRSSTRWLDDPLSGGPAVRP